MMPEKPTYHANALSWASSESEAARRSRNLAWMVAAALCLIAIFEALALTSLAPLKSVKVVPVLVDRQTGFVEVLRENGQVAVSPDTALTRAMLAQYVLAREGYNITTVGAEYRRVMLWSAGTARSSYASLMPAQNPASPLSIYPRSTVVEGKIESVSDLSPHTALVRFTTRRHDNASQTGPIAYFAAVITYDYAPRPLRVEDRLVNPLGFQVVHYQRDEEVAPPPVPSRSNIDFSQNAQVGPSNVSARATTDPQSLRPPEP